MGGLLLCRSTLIDPHGDRMAATRPSVLQAGRGCYPVLAGRRNPVHSGYSPQFYVRTTDVPGVLDFGGMSGSGDTVASAMPGETVQVAVALGKPVALDAGQTFAIREGGRTVGAGTVTALLD
ncbi:MAG: hypothetical protein ACRDPY_23585 [Streptosporangiaceae bacterium]